MDGLNPQTERRKNERLYFITSRSLNATPRPQQEGKHVAKGSKTPKDTADFRNAEGQPVTIPKGRWYINPKARAERLLLNSLSSDARRVYACLELHSIAYHQEECVIDEGKRRRPLTPADVRAKTKLTKQGVYRALIELERAGLAERRATDAGGLRNGRVKLICFLEPRETAAHHHLENARPSAVWPDWFPSGCEPLKAYITQQKISLLANIDEIFEVDAREYFIAELEEAARAHFEAAEVLARKLERVRARHPLNRKKGNASQKETAAAADGATPPNPEAPAAAAAPPPEPGETRTAAPQNPPAPGNAAPAAEEAGHASPPPPAEVEVPADAESVLAAMEPYCGEPEAARKLIAGCRKIAPECTIEEICVFTAVKAREIPRRRKRPVENPVGFLIETVPDFFRGNYKTRPIPGIPNPSSPDLENFVQDTIRLAAILRTRRKSGAD